MAYANEVGILTPHYQFSLFFMVLLLAGLIILAILVMKCHYYSDKPLEFRYEVEIEPLTFTYEVKIEKFSTMNDTVDIYKSEVFEVEGYKWKLVVHPNGNKRKNVTDHISLYLAMAERIELGWEVNAVFNLYLKNYQSSAGSEPKRERRCHFHPLKLENGFDKFIKLDEFKKHLVKEKDTCTFGVEVVSVQLEQKNGRAERLSMLEEEESSVTYTWKIHKFSSKLNEECLDSEIFGDQNRKWKIQLYPKKKKTRGTDLCIYLALANPTSFASTTRIYAQVTLRTQLLDKAKCKHTTTTVKDWFGGSSPKQELVTLDYRCKKSSGESDTVSVEAEVKVLGIADAIP